MKYKDIANKLKKLGCYKAYSCSGSHRIRHNPATGKDFPVVDHGSKEVPPPTLSEMIRLSGISRKDFISA